MFHHTSKHRDESCKYDVQRSIFDELEAKAFGSVMKYSQVLHLLN